MDDEVRQTMMAEDLEVSLLGPVEVFRKGKNVPLAPLERSMFAVMALAPRQVVSTERIIKKLWAEKVPASPRTRVQAIVSSLRRKIGAVLVTRQPGYLLNLPDPQIDIGRCEALVHRAHTANTDEEIARSLSQALSLWHGEPLDGVTTSQMDPDRARLREYRLSLMEERFDAELSLGNHGDLISELVAAVVANPMRERLAKRLMLALYRCDRQAEALTVYSKLRQRLAEELGSDPSSDLRELHTRILRGEEHRTTTTPTPAQDDNRWREPTPAQMPAGVGHFTGRREELETLNQALPGSAEEPRVVIVSGAGGLGKTALATHWAHQVAHEFPDGQVFVRLRTIGGGAPITSGSALGTVLLALGVNAEKLPISVEERAALYRTMMHRRRVLIVADDAASTTQLLPLVPPTSGSLVVATSRFRLAALTAHHAVQTLTLQPFPPETSRQLLCAMVGRQRFQGEPAEAITETCGGWPLAIRLAAATLAARPWQTLDSFADELHDTVDVLSITDDPRTVRAALAAQYAELEPGAARLFAQLGVLPGSTTCLALAAATAGTTTMRARRLLDELISVNLIVESSPDRYRLPDMVRRFSRYQASLLPDAEIVAARVVRWYVEVFETLASRHAPVRYRLAVADGETEYESLIEDKWSMPQSSAEWMPFTQDGSHAREFIAAETPNLTAVTDWLSARVEPEQAWRMVLFAHLSGAELSVSTSQLGLAAAQETGDPGTAGEAHALLGMVLLRHSQQLEVAQRHLALSLRLLESRDGRVSCAASFGLGMLRAKQGRYVEAHENMERALRYLDPGSEPVSYAVALSQYAEQLVSAGLVERGHERFAQVVILCRAALGTRDDRLGVFDRQWQQLNRQLAEEYLDYLNSLLDTPRVAEPDRGLARFLILISKNLVAPRAIEVPVAIPRQRAGLDDSAVTPRSAVTTRSRGVADSRNAWVN